jgi:hypothetical protein
MVYRDLVVYVKSLNANSVAANTAAEQTFAVTGLDASRDVVLSVSCADPTNGLGALGIGNARISADDTLALTFVNATEGAINASASNFVIVVGRTSTDPSADGDRL